MKISSKGRYAVEALIYLATLPNAPAQVKDIAKKTAIPQKYLEQIFFALRQANILAAKRGPSGGYYFQKSPQELTVGDIIRILEGEIIAVDCLQDKSACITMQLYEGCITRAVWQEISSTISDIMDSITIAALAFQLQGGMGL